MIKKLPTMIVMKIYITVSKARIPVNELINAAVIVRKPLRRITKANIAHDLGRLFTTFTRF